MLFSSWLQNRKRSAPAARKRARTRARPETSFRPQWQALDHRWLPSGLPYPTAATVSQLISDISYANKTGGAFTVNLKPTTTFDLKSVNNTTNGANGLPLVGGTKAVDLTITGNGDTIERVGSKQFCLINVAPRPSLTLDHVKLQQALNSYGSGVAINNHGTLVVSYCTVSNISGGGISNSGGTVMISNSILSGNAAYVFGSDGGGGGIYNDPHGTVTVENSSSITGNDSGVGEDVSIEDVYNLGVLYLDRTSTIGILDGNPAIS
jgi:hypothetical protein